MFSIINLVSGQCFTFVGSTVFSYKLGSRVLLYMYYIHVNILLVSNNKQFYL